MLKLMSSCLGVWYSYNQYVHNALRGIQFVYSEQIDFLTIHQFRPTFVNTWLRSWKDNARVIEFHSVDSAKYRFEPLGKSFYFYDNTILGNNRYNIAGGFVPLPKEQYPPRK